MTLLDRWRPKPSWQHTDPGIRGMAVRQLGSDQQEVLGKIARSDADAQVRRAAVRKLKDVSILASILSDDQNEGVRGEAARTLTEIALGDEGSSNQAAVEALKEPKHLASVAQRAPAESVRIAALSRLTQPHALSEVARSALDSSTRLAALGKIHDAPLLGQVALKSEYKDVACAAVERIEDRALLEVVATKARNRAASRRAKALLGTMSGGAALRASERRLRLLQVCRTLEALLRSVDFAVISEQLASCRAAWVALGGAEPELKRRFESACQALEERLELQGARLAQERLRAVECERGIESRAALCERLETATLTPEEVKHTQSLWESLPPLEGSEAQTLAKRFSRAIEVWHGRLENARVDDDERSRVESLCQKLEALASADSPDLSWKALELKWTRFSSGIVDAGLRGRIEEALRGLREKDNLARGEHERRQRENEARLQALCSRLEALAKVEMPGLRDAESALREARHALENLGTLPSKRSREALAARLKAGRAALYPRVHELRDTLEWKQWANLGVQEDLCQKMEALRERDDFANVLRERSAIQAQWKSAREVPKEKAQELWTRFAAAREVVEGRCQAYLARQKEEHLANQRLKEELCARAEALEKSTDWVKTAQAIQKLQAEWRSIGRAHEEEAIWARFRGACHRFFERRREDLSKRRAAWARNLERKEALCAQAEALAESREWSETATKIKALQAEWKTIGPVRKSRSDVVWERFRKATDRFFDSYKRREEVDRAAHVERLEALCRQLEDLLGGPPEAPEALASRVQAARLAWGHSPPRGDQKPLAERFAQAVSRLVEAHPDSFAGTDLDPKITLKKMEKLCLRAEKLLRETQDPLLTAEVDLADRLREALASNTMGGKRDPESRRRLLIEEKESLFSAWDRLGPTPGDAARDLVERFRKASEGLAAIGAGRSSG